MGYAMGARWASDAIDKMKRIYIPLISYTIYICTICLLCKLTSRLGAVWYRGSYRGAAPVDHMCMELLEGRSLG